MKALLIPIKDPARGKTRLSELLSAEERTRLAWAMFEDVCRAVSACKRADRVVIVTSFARAIERARASGWDVLIEESQISESTSVDWASRRLAESGFNTVMRLPADIPTVKAEDIDELLAFDLARPGAALVPSREGTGTNAVIRTPPDLFPSRFGPDSLKLHKQEAARVGIDCIVIENARIALDIDEPSDIELLLERGRGTESFDTLARMNVEERLNRLRIADCGLIEHRVSFSPKSAIRNPQSAIAMSDCEIRLIGVQGIPEIAAGDDLGTIIARAVRDMGIELADKDIIVIAQKVVSKAEGRVLRLDGITPSRLAREWAEAYDKDARMVEAVLSESRRIVRMERGVMICETRHGFVCANAGIDASNVAEDTITLLPENPDDSARLIQTALEQAFKVRVAVIVSDTFGRPWREGIANVAIGIAGIAPLIDYRGQLDSHGRPLRVTVIAVADELASAAELVMQKSAGIPVVIIRGFDYEARAASARELVRPPEQDLFR